MDPLSLTMACALVFQPNPEGLRCETSRPLISLPTERVDGTKADVHKMVSATSKWQPVIARASQRFQVPKAWIAAVMDAESAGHTTLNGRPIRSPAGAQGLMQLMPGTYDDMRRRFGLGYDAYDPRDNIFAGTAYLRAMYERYGYPHLFAAYNAGPTRFDTYLLAGEPLPSETRAYVEKIIPGTNLDGQTVPTIASKLVPKMPVKARGFASSGALFFVRSAAESDDKIAHETVATSPKKASVNAALFVPLTGDLHKTQN